MAMFVSIIPLSPRFSRSSWCLITVSSRNFMLWCLVLMWTMDCCTRPSIQTSLKYWSFFFLTNHSVLSFFKTYIIYFLCSWTTWVGRKCWFLSQGGHAKMITTIACSSQLRADVGYDSQVGFRSSQESALCLTVLWCKCVVWNSRLQLEMAQPPVPVTLPPLCHRGPLALWNKPSH